MDLEDIPTIMRAKTWVKGAKLMERWFKGAAFKKPDNSIHNYAAAETSLIDWGWLFRFQRVAKVFGEMVDQKVWDSDAAKPVMKDALRKVAGGATASMSVDLSARSAIELHGLQVNFRYVESGMSDPLDELFAALGSFSLYVFPLSFVVDAPNVIILQQVGFHAYDSYDFNDSSIAERFHHGQSLGYWRLSDNEVSKFPIPGSDPVTNDDFREWRSARGRGGDFPIYSELLPFQLPNPLTIRL